MGQKQSFNLTADYYNSFPSIFMNLVYIIIIVFMLVMVFNFFRDKFIKNETNTKKDNIYDLLLILNKLFLISGFGFVIANICQFVLDGIFGSSNNFPSVNLRGDWEYLTFGIIIIFVGIGFKMGYKAFKKE